MRKKHDELLDSRNSSAEVASSLCHEDSGSISLSQQNKKIVWNVIQNCCSFYGKGYLKSMVGFFLTAISPVLERCR